MLRSHQVFVIVIVMLKALLGLSGSPFEALSMLLFVFVIGHRMNFERGYLSFDNYKCCLRESKRPCNLVSGMGFRVCGLGRER